MNGNLDEALSGGAGLTGVQWVLQAPPTRKVLRRELSAMLGAGGRLGSCRLRRVKFKPGRHLKAYYDVSVYDGSTGTASIRPIEVRWTPRGAEHLSPTPASFALEAEALSRGSTAPFARLVGDLPAWGMRIQIAPIDPAFPQLARVFDPAYVCAMLGANGWPQSSASLCSVTPIRYRPGQRHVFRYDLAEAPGSSILTLFAKVYNSDKGTRTFAGGTHMSDWLASRAAGVAAVRPAAYVAADSVVLYPRVTGTPLVWQLRHPGRRTEHLLRDTGAALRLVQHMPEGLIELKAHSFAAEMRSIASASTHLKALLPSASARVEAILGCAQELHERLPQEPPALAYGDFKADHVWITPQGLTLIDFDTFYRFDPAIDAGKFLADLHWWYDSYGLPGVEQAQAQFLEGYAPGIPPARLLRARLYEVLVLVKITARRVRLFDRDWAPRTERLIDRAAAALQQFSAGL